MRNALKYWDFIAQKLAGRRIYLFLDYDGTLVPIAPTPEQAVLSPAARQKLQELALFENCRMAVISGRALSDVKALVAVEEIVYAGNHGLEIGGSGVVWADIISEKMREDLNAVKERVRENLDHIPGVQLEDKGLTMSVHYRNVGKDMVDVVRRKFRDTVRPARLRNRVRVSAGKCVYEVRPAVDWHKGMAVRWLLEEEEKKCRGRVWTPVFIGDDLTDEDAFRELKGKGVTIWVGETNLYAQFVLKDTEEVFEWLGRLRELLGKEAYRDAGQS